MDRNAKYISVAATGIGVRVYPGTEVERFALLNNSIKKDFSWSVSFKDQNIESLGNDPLVPILIQPQFGWREFRKIEFRLARFWLKNPRAALGVLCSQFKLGGGLVFLRLIQQFIKLHVFSVLTFRHQRR
jgi:hypothetical protein